MRTILLLAALALPPRAGAAAVSGPCSANSGPQGPDNPRLREWLRALVHEVAREEGVDPHVLEALGMTETALQPALGPACEVGPFQVMPWWAGVFRLDSPQLLWDPRINAIAAARIYKAAWQRWDARFARAGANRVLRAAGWRGPLDRETFAALAYNWGKALKAFAQATDLRTVSIPASTASYALRFSQALREARQRARADNGIPRARRL
ncbi:MAG TPA: transglycosylase SLT domain-containing protein [Myxococcales bacterium]|nr:transglycosylase SLT domain-containing protein [Myxococcales bacterium]